MRLRRLSAAATTAAMFTTGLVPVGSGTAYAGLPGVAHTVMTVYFVRNIPGRVIGYDVCVQAGIDDGAYNLGQWVVTVAGWRSNASLIAPLPVVRPGPALTYCYFVPKDGTDYGQFTMQVTLANGGVDATTYGTAIVTWDPILLDRATVAGT